MRRAAQTTSVPLVVISQSLAQGVRPYRSALNGTANLTSLEALLLLWSKLTFSPYLSSALGATSCPLEIFRLLVFESALGWL